VRQPSGCGHQQSPEGCLTLALRLDLTRSDDDEHQPALQHFRQLGNGGGRRGALHAFARPALPATVVGPGRHPHRADHDPAGCDRRERRPALGPDRAVAAGQQGVDPRDAGTAGALNNVAQQLGAALGVAIISTFVASATNHYLTDHGSTAVVTATVHGFTVGYWWAAGAFWAGAVICRSLIRGGTRLRPQGGEPEPLDEISGLF
jgi:hypothetical protein